MWTIQRMDDMDDGDEERLPGEPMMTAVTSVSYTHLDVYKRQLHDRKNGTPAGHNRGGARRQTDPADSADPDVTQI